MRKKIINTGDKHTDKMLKEKTFQDFNNKEPDKSEVQKPVRKKQPRVPAPLPRKKG